jgi:hypothetical protein
MKKTKKEFEKWAMVYLKKIQKILLLDDFHPLSIEPSNKKNISECKFNYPYKSINIGYSDGVFEDFQKGKIEDVLGVLVHEMCHSITDPLYSKAVSRYVGKDEIEDERERLTDHIANILLKNIKL